MIKKNNVEYIISVFESEIIKQYFKNNNLVLSKKRPISNKENNIILNLSQCSRKHICDHFKFILEKGYKVIDCSMSNVKLCGNFKNHIYIPYQLKEKETIFLKNMLSQQKKHDVCFVGTLSPRRKKILEDLKKSGVDIVILENIYGHERDAKISECRILLNIHFDVDHKVYESLRCDRWSLNGMMLVTEESIFEFYNETEELITVTNYENLKNKTIEVLNNYEENYKNYIKKLSETIDQKKKDRENYLINII